MLVAHEVTRVQMGTGGRDGDVEHAAALGVFGVEGGTQVRAGRAEPVDAEAVVEAVGDAELLVVGLDIAAERLGRAEIERGALDVAQLPGGNRVLVDDEHLRRVDGDDLSQDASGIMAGQVEVGMVGHVHERAAIGGRRVAQAQDAGGRERVLRRERALAGKAELAVG